MVPGCTGQSKIMWTNLGLLWCDAMHGKAAFHVVDQSEVLASSLNCNHV